MWKPLLQTEFQQNSFNSVECHTKNNIDQKISVTLTILPENCDSQYTKNITSDTLSALLIVCLAVGSADKIKRKHQKTSKRERHTAWNTNLNTEHNNDLIGLHYRAMTHSNICCIRIKRSRTLYSRFTPRGCKVRICYCINPPSSSHFH